MSGSRRDFIVSLKIHFVNHIILGFVVIPIATPNGPIPNNNIEVIVEPISPKVKQFS